MSNEAEDKGTPIISLWQPWSNWVAMGWKPIETRLHQRFASLVGRRIGIHAACKWDDAALDEARPYLSDAQISATRQFFRVGGAIIATGYVKEHRELNPLDSRYALIDCEHITRYGLILTDITIIPAIPAKGKQGIWYAHLAAPPEPEAKK